MRVVHNAFWLSASRVGADALSFLLFVAISRKFGPSGIGQYSYAFGVAGVFALLATAGLEEYGIRRYARADTQERATVWSTLLAAQGVQLGIAMVLLVPFLLAGGGRATPGGVLAALLTYMLGYSLARTLFVPAVAFQAMRTPALLDFGCRACASLVALSLIFNGATSLSMALVGFPLAGLAFAFLAMRNAAAHGAALQSEGSWKAAATVWRRTGPFAGSEILNQFYARVDILLIGNLVGAASLGVYATGLKFVEIGLLPLGFLGTAVYPSLTTLASTDMALFRAAARDFIATQFFLAGWLGVGITLLVPPLLELMLGPAFAATLPLMPIFAVLALAKGAELAFFRVLYCIHKELVYMYSLVAGTVLILVLNLLLIPKFGLMGALIATIASTAAVCSGCAMTLINFIDARALLGILARTLSALIGTTAVVLVTTRLGGGAWQQAAAGCFVYPLLAYLVRLPPNPRRSAMFNHARTRA